MPRPVIIIAVVIAVLGLIGLVYFSTACACDHEPSPNVGITMSQPTPQNTPPQLPTACGANPAPARPTLPTEFGYRELTSPVVESPVSTPLRIAGQANPFEGAFTVTILDRQGRRVATQDFTKDNRNLAFNVALPFEVTQPMPACVWVHERSGRDGSPTNVTQVPVLLVP